MDDIYKQQFQKRIEDLHREGRYRVFMDITRKRGHFPYGVWRNGAERKDVVIWCSNDYLSMGEHPKVIEAMHLALDEAGAGAGGTRNISGTNHYHIELERELSDLHDKQATLLFSSGYAANEAVLSLLARLQPDMEVFSDELNHASMIEGIRHGGGQKHIFRHNDLADLERLLASIPLDKPKLIAFESVYSMDGDFAPIAEICALAKKYRALTYLDEVHAVGLYGKHGAGLAERDGCAQKVDIIQGTLAKGFGGQGGYIASDAVFIDAVRSYASMFIFTTAMSPVLAAGALAAIRHLKSDSSQRQALHQKAKQLKNLLISAGFPVMPNPSHIVPILVKDPTECKQISQNLLNQFGIYVQPINYPTVPRGTERLRLTPSPKHSEDMMTALVQALKIAWPRADYLAVS